MPYTSNEELPVGVRHKLPIEAQNIYREAFNHAWEFYKDPHKRHKDRTQEETAHSVAWSAVEKKYNKDEHHEWVKI